MGGGREGGGAGPQHLDGFIESCMTGVATCVVAVWWVHFKVRGQVPSPFEPRLRQACWDSCQPESDADKGLVPLGTTDNCRTTAEHIWPTMHESSKTETKSVHRPRAAHKPHMITSEDSQPTRQRLATFLTQPLLPFTLPCTQNLLTVTPSLDFEGLPLSLMSFHLVLNARGEDRRRRLDYGWLLNCTGRGT